MVESTVDVVELKGASLRYMLAVALEYKFKAVEPTYGLSHRILCEGSPSYFRPDIDWYQLGPLLEKHWREATGWLTEYFGPNWRDQVDGLPGSLPRWFCIAIIGSHLGNQVQVPTLLIQS